MNFLRFCRIAITVISLGCLSASAFAQDTQETRAVAAERYLKIVPMSKMLDDSYKAIGQQIPEDKREEFIAELKKVVKVEFLEKLARESMIKTFTTDELNAMADFYGSQHGSSIMKKFGVYMAEFMPALQEEIKRSINELQKSNKIKK